jgi:FG-GAP-like repeat
VLLNDGNGTFANPVTYTVGGNPLWLAVGDLDGDTDADLAVTRSFPVPVVSVLLNAGDGTFGAAANYEAGTGLAGPWKIAIGDFNGDTGPDVAVTNLDGNVVSVLLNNGDGTFATAASYDVGDGPTGIAVADFNGDAEVDVAVSNTRSNNVSVLLNNGAGTFAPAVNTDVDVQDSGMAVEDFNGDAEPDLVVTTESAMMAVLLHD